MAPSAMLTMERRPRRSHPRSQRSIRPRWTMGAPSGGTCPVPTIRTSRNEMRRPSMGTGDAKLDLLRTVSLFADLGRKDLEEVGRLADTVDVPADKVLMRSEEHTSELQSRLHLV